MSFLNSEHEAQRLFRRSADRALLDIFPRCQLVGFPAFYIDKHHDQTKNQTDRNRLDCYREQADGLGVFLYEQQQGGNQHGDIESTESEDKAGSSVVWWPHLKT